MCFSSPPAVPPVPPPPADPATEADQGVKDARNQAKTKARAAQGLSSTILTGPQGDTSTPILAGYKDRLGQ